MAKRVTNWFPASVKPVHIGLYECERKEIGGVFNKRFLLWDGDDWKYPDGFGGWAAMYEPDGDKWRGLAADPSAKPRSASGRAQRTNKSEGEA